MRKLSNIIGIAQNNPSEFLSSLLPKDIDINLIEDLISQRQAARSEKNWAKADEIRDKLISLNIKLEDSQNTTLWVYKNK